MKSPLRTFSRQQKLYLVTAAHFNPLLVSKMTESAVNSYPELHVFVAAHGDRFYEDLKLVMTNVPGELVHIQKLPDTVGTATAWNVGREFALQNSASHVLYSLPNVMFYDDAIERLLEAFNQLKGVGAVGPITNHCWSEFGQVQQDPSFRIEKKRTVDYYDRDGSPQKATVNRLNPVPYINGFCFLTSRKVLEAVGKFDEGFPPLCGYEDDFFFRCRIAGLKLYIDFGAFVYNLGMEVDKTRGLVLNKMKEAAAERIIDKYQIKGREVLYSRAELDKDTRDRLMWLIRSTPALLRDMSGYDDYKQPELPEATIKEETIR